MKRLGILQEKSVLDSEDLLVLPLQWRTGRGRAREREMQDGRPQRRREDRKEERKAGRAGGSDWM